MNIIVKTVGNKKFPLVDVAPGTTVSDFRSRIADELDLGGDVKKLIFKGKSLKDGMTLESCGLENDCEVVCLVKKVRAGRKSKSPSPAKADAPKAGNAAPEKREYKIKKEDALKLMGMGFPQHMVMISLKAAYGDPKLAAQYLIAGGIPADRAAALQKEYDAQKAGGASAPAAPVQQPRTRGPQGMDARFEAMLASPESMQAILGNKQVQQQCLQMLAVEQPQLFQQFCADPEKVGETEAFTKAMFQILQKSFSAKPRQRQVIKLSEEDRNSIKELQQSKRLARQQAVQIYLNNGKDLARAKAYCDELMEKAIAQAEASGKLSPEERAEIQRMKAQAADQGTDVLSSSITHEENTGKAPAQPSGRKALSPRNSNVPSGNASAKPEKASRSPPTAADTENTVLNIPLDMLMDDEE